MQNVVLIRFSRRKKLNYLCCVVEKRGNIA